MNPLSVLASVASLCPKLLTFGHVLAQATARYSQREEASPLETVLGLALAILLIASMWKIFSKADYPGWAAIIPFYNLYVLCQVSGKSGWWMLLMFIPLVNIVVYILLMIGLAANFGRGVLFGLGLFFLSFIFLPVLAFGDFQYQGATGGHYSRF